MADQQTTDVVVEGGKLVGSGGVGMLVLGLIQRWLKKEDDGEKQILAMLGEIKVATATLTTSVGALTTDVKLLVQAHGATRADVDKLEAIVNALQLELATLRGKFDHLSEQLAK